MSFEVNDMLKTRPDACGNREMKVWMKMKCLNAEVFEKYWKLAESLRIKE